MIRIAALPVCLLVCGCIHGPITPAPAPERMLAAAITGLRLSPETAILVGTGDIARCEESEWAAATARLVEAVIREAPDAVVFTTGDHAYEDGTAIEFRECYDPAWGAFNARTRPTPGNHDYETGDAAAYFDYFDLFDARPGARPIGYYAYDLGAWQIIALNSMLQIEPESLQVRWLEEVLDASDRGCILAYWHHPLFSSGFHGFVPWDAGRDTAVIWDVLAARGADLIVNGHDHLYERFAPQDSDGVARADGLMQITVGTGGGGLHPVIRRRPNSAYLQNDMYGVLILMLGEHSYEWAFVGVDGVVHDRSNAPVACR